LKIKDLSVSDVMALKYLACRFIMSNTEDDFVDDIITEMTKDRLAKKHNIQDADKKDLDLVIYQITQGHTKEEKDSLVSATYDYVVNSMFTIENTDADDDDEYFPDSLIIRPKNHVIAAKVKSIFGTIIMRVMTEEYYKQVKGTNDINIKSLMTATENATKRSFALVVM